MIIVRVELHSAVDGKITELARMHICNAGGDTKHGDYEVRTLRGRSRTALDAGVVQRRGRVLRHARLALHVWHLVAKALIAVGYAQPLPEADRQDAEAGRPTEELV